MGDYTEEEFRREFVEELTEDEEYERDSRRIAHVEECSGLDRDIFSKYGAHFKDDNLAGDGGFSTIVYCPFGRWHDDDRGFHKQ